MGLVYDSIFVIAHLAIAVFVCYYHNKNNEMKMGSVSDSMFAIAPVATTVFCRLVKHVENY